MEGMMTIRVAAALLVGILATACGPKVQMQMIRAADVSVPSTVQKVAVIDRSGASNIGQGILGVLEGALSGEAIGADTEGRRETVRGLREMLATSSRYEVAQPAGIDREQSLFDRELSWRGATKICRDAGCDAIVALEAFDSDTSDDFRSRQVERTDSNGRKYNATEWTVDRRTRVLTAWRIYQPEGQRILDDLRDRTDTHSWTGRGDSRAEAMRNLPSQFDAVRLSAYRAGAAYGRRISPTPLLVYRSFYPRGGKSDALKLGKNYMRARDYEGAIRVYEGLTDHPESKIRGRAQFNLAVAEEAMGRFERSLTAARAAAVTLGNGRARRYVVTVEQRIRERDRVQEQMAPPPEEGPEIIQGPRRPSTGEPTPPSDGTMTRPTP
jgi:hypothetical protein